MTPILCYAAIGYTVFTVADAAGLGHLRAGILALLSVVVASLMTAYAIEKGRRL